MYSPLQISAYFDKRLRAFYPIPPGIAFNLFDVNHGTGKPPDWRIQIANVDHEEPWEMPWGRLDGPDFGRVFHDIALEIEKKFGVSFPRQEKKDV